ncbi:hypothetical protein [Burkholderia metallica]|uniref:hypothetical protein n=1 Tax=Burkholderia metallica TaxID=488729 RepID=UPI0008418FEA|nr:hypothetical protein [Burkholderia metallica]AOJ34645.1 hypothetical protein WJ16_24055 [Burkholderia metallica]
MIGKSKLDRFHAGRSVRKNPHGALLLCSLLLASTPGFAGINQGTYFPPTNPTGNVINIDYDFPASRPARYFDKLETSFTFNKLNSNPIGTRFVATQFWLDPTNGAGGGDTIYIGINPTVQSYGYGGQAHFSYFGKNAGQLYNSNCAKGADGGSGITCALNLPTTQGYTYHLTATLIESTAQHAVLSGTVDVLDGAGDPVQTVEIGKFEILRGNMALSYPGSWVEGSSDPCTSLVKTGITFSPLLVTYFNTGGKDKYTSPINTVSSNKCGVNATPVGVRMDYGR